MINEYYAKRFCKDDISIIENYELAINDTTQTWHCHHRMETDEHKSATQLIGDGLYLGRPASELIFLTKSEHMRLHQTGKHLSDETKKKMSEARSGENNPNYGKHLSDETKKKMSEARSGENHPNYGKHLSEETKKKIAKANSKPILQYSKYSEFIKEWLGANEAARVLGINQGHITNCCQGKRKSAGGYVWKYV